MQIYCSQYSLSFLSEVSPLAGAEVASRQGALLKIEFSDDLIGYADCHPWVQFGDFPLEQQLERLCQGQTTPLLQRSLQLARLDAEARSRRISLFEGLTIPPSHFLVSDLSAFDPKILAQLTSSGFQRIKIKLGKNLAAEIPLLSEILVRLTGSDILVRLDFNSQVNQQVFEDFLRHIQPHWGLLDFCEDPFPYQPEAWQAVQDRYSIDLAADRECLQADGHPQSAGVLVIKPAIQDLALIRGQCQRIIVTSYLDHPVGQLGAAYSAASSHKLLDICGLQSHTAYVPSPFSNEIVCCGPHIICPKGAGIGFDELLAQVDWGFCYAN